MITEVVTFALPEGMTREQVIAAFRDSTPNWRGNPDLIRKHYLYDPERRIGGGVYLWKSIDDARRWHGDAFKERIARAYGSEPAFAYFETPIVIDNAAGEVRETSASVCARAACSRPTVEEMGAMGGKKAETRKIRG